LENVLAFGKKTFQLKTSKEIVLTGVNIGIGKENLEIKTRITFWNWFKNNKVRRNRGESCEPIWPRTGAIICEKSGTVPHSYSVTSGSNI
jgi:hypothetical protein